MDFKGTTEKTESLSVPSFASCPHSFFSHQLTTIGKCIFNIFQMCVYNYIITSQKKLTNCFFTTESKQSKHVLFP